MTAAFPDHAAYRAKVRDLAAAAGGAESDRLGTLRLIDDAARLRAVQSLRSGVAVSLAREMRRHDPQAGFPAMPVGRQMFAHSRRVDAAPLVPFDYFADESWAIGNDHVEFEVHGHLTHVDGFGHVIIDGTVHGGSQLEDTAHSVADFAEFGVFTRAVFADIPAARGTDWVDAGEPVTGTELDEAVARAGVVFEPGDALLVYMGRDRFETCNPPPELLATHRPGIGVDGAEWIADNRVSVLCWDFVDANHPTQPRMAVHVLIWAIGLVVVDCCEFTRAAQVARDRGVGVGALALAPLRIPGATGSPVNPLLVL